MLPAVTDPVAAKLVENPDAPEGNITGTSDAIPVDQVFELMNQLTKLLSVSTGISLIGVPSSTFTTIAAVCLPSRV